MRMLTHIAARILGRPLLIHPGKASAIIAALTDRIGVSAEIDEDVDPAFLRLAAASPAANRLVPSEPGGPRDAMGRVKANYYDMVGSTALIPIVGSLVNRGAFIGDDGSGFTSYEGLTAQVQMAVADPYVSSILLDIDSPGGEVAGAFSLFDTIRQARAQKPVVAHVNDMAASAAYGIAASASEIVVSPSSVLGSVGVVALHMDHSAQLARKGIKPTFVYAGAKKIDGNSLEPLSASARADLQAEVDLLYNQFVGTVAEGRRGILSPEAIRATEAGTMFGSEAVKVGFADRVASFNDTISRMQLFSKAIGGPINMNPISPSTPVGSLPLNAPALTQADVDAARAEGRREGEAAGASAATARIRAILTHAAAQGREAMALRLALDTDMTAEAAVTVMESAPSAPTRSAPPVSERANPPVPGSDPKPASGNGAASWDAIYDKMNKSAGVQPHPLA